MQLSGGAGARQHETIGRFAHAGECQRIDDGAVRLAAPARGVAIRCSRFSVRSVALTVLKLSSVAPPAGPRRHDLDAKRGACPTIREARLSIFSTDDGDKRETRSAEKDA